MLKSAVGLVAQNLVSKRQWLTCAESITRNLSLHGARPVSSDEANRLAGCHDWPNAMLPISIQHFSVGLSGSI